MRDALLPTFETFLVQDVILTLGNLRGSLAWLADGGAEVDPAIYRAGLERLDRQIEQLQDRARAMCPSVTPHSATLVTPCSAAAYTVGSGMSLENVLRDALGEEAADLRPLFRSQRAAHG